MNVLLICIFVFFSSHQIHADIKGSNLAVSVEPFFTFPQTPLIDPNEMRGFGWFSSGFALQNASTTCLFTGVFPVSGTINLNSGTFTLNQDFIMKDVVTLQGLGTIIGNNHKFEICPSVTEFPNTQAVFDAVELVINNDLVLTSTLTFQGSCTIVGNGNTIFLGSDGGILINSGATLLLRDVTIKDISNGNILCADNSSRLILDTMMWYQNGSYTFGTGSIKFVDHVGFFGRDTFIYDSAYTSTITAESTWQIYDDMVLCIGKHEENGNQPLYMEDVTSKLQCSNCHVHVNQYGIILTRGSIIFDDIVILDDDSTSTMNGIVIGNGILDEDPVLKFEVGASVLLKSSHLVFNTGSNDVIKTGAHKGGRLKRYIGSNIYLKTDLTFPSMSVEADSLAIPAMVLASDVTLAFNDTLVVFPNALFDITSARTNSYSYTLKNGDSIALTRGVFPLNVQIYGASNSINGNGSVSGNITLTDENAELNVGLQGFINGVVALNNGTMRLTNNLKMGTDSVISGSGTIDMTDKVLHLPFFDFDFTSTVELIGNSATVNLHSKMSLRSTMTISGDVIINGSGNVLEITDTGSIYLQDNATLTIKDVYLSNFKDGDIVYATDRSRIIIDDSHVSLGSNIIFDVGSMLFRNNVDIVGTYTFTYASSQTSTISDNTIVKISDGLKFIIGRHAISKAESIVFASESSILHLDNAAMKISSLGARFVKGSLLCDNDVSIDIVATTTSEGLELGDGLAQDTTKVILNAGVTLRNLGGVIVYNIGNPNGFVSHSRTAQIVRSPLSETYLKTNINLSNVTTRLLNTPLLNISTPTILNYDNVGVDLPSVEFIITGRRYTNSSNLLGGNGLIFMTRGTYPQGTVVSGTNNIIRGNGAIGGPIIFLNSSAQLEWILNGMLLGDTTLNGGTFILSNNMHLGRGTKINNGTINLRSYSLAYGTKDLTISQNNYFDGDSGVIELSSDITLDATWTFSKNCTINGNGNKLKLAAGAILVEKGSILRLKNIKLEGVKNNNIRCLDDNGRLILDGVNWKQTDNFIYEFGILEYYNKVKMSGDSAVSFAYQSCHTSTIHSGSTVLLDEQFTFSYDPIYVASKNLLVFENDSSCLELHSATLHTTVTGMELTNGILRVSRSAYLSAEKEITDNGIINEGITFGNENVSNDMYIDIISGQGLFLTHGTIKYKNIDSQSLNFSNLNSYIDLYPQTSLYAYQNIYLNTGYLILGDGITLGRALGKDIIGSVVPLGNYSNIGLS